MSHTSKMAWVVCLGAAGIGTAVYTEPAMSRGASGAQARADLAAGGLQNYIGMC